MVPPVPPVPAPTGLAVPPVPPILAPPAPPGPIAPPSVALVLMPPGPLVPPGVPLLMVPPAWPPLAAPASPALLLKPELLHAGPISAATKRAATTVDILNIWSSVCSPAERQTQSTGESRSLYTNLEARRARRSSVDPLMAWSEQSHTTRGSSPNVHLTVQ
jgi:hypothetical protein